MFSESHRVVRRAVRFFLLPYCFLRLVNWKECKKSRFAVLGDLLYIFFVLNDYPDNYGPCRLWEYSRKEWPKFYGSNYNPHQRERLRREVHPLDLERALRDKEVADGLCRRMGIPVPETVGILYPGQAVSTELDSMFGKTTSDRLIIKPVHGHAGLGVALALRETSGRLIIKSGSRELAPSEYVLPESCLVQEVLVQTADLAAIAPSSLNTLRLLTMLDRSDEVLVVGASMRFGVGSAFIDNWSAGGIAVGVDQDRGTLMAYGYDKKGNRYTHHPISQVKFDGLSIAGWESALDVGYKVQRAFPFFKLLGMDLGFTDSGVVLIEINNDADLVFQEQTSGPLLASRRIWDAFAEYDLFYNEKQRALFK
jgi:hypothetical protein